MKKILTVICSLASLVSVGQPSCTTFDKFITKSSVEWAAYVNDTIRFEKPGLNKLLLSRFEKKEINAALYMWGRSVCTDYFSSLSKDKLDEIVFHIDTIPMYDSLGNVITPALNNKGINIDTVLFTKTDIAQILYIEKGKLKSYVTWVSPMIPIVTSFGLFLGDGGYFSTCFNRRYNYKPRKKNTIIFLSESRRNIRMDTVTNDESRLKELYGRNLIETLWPYILDGKIDAFETKTNSKLQPEEINSYLMNKTRIPVPVYDTTGTVSGFEFRRTDFDPKLITSIDLLQDWYYDQKKNIVFNTIRELYLYTTENGAGGEIIKNPPVLKIVFK